MMSQTLMLFTTPNLSRFGLIIFLHKQSGTGFYRHRLRHCVSVNTTILMRSLMGKLPQIVILCCHLSNYGV